MVPVTCLLEEYGEEINLDEILRKARCTNCGFQGNNQMWLRYVCNSALAQTGSAINSDKGKEV